MSSAIPVEFEWVTPAFIGCGIVLSMLIVLCPRKEHAQAVFDAASPRPEAAYLAGVDNDAVPATGVPEGAPRST